MRKAARSAWRTISNALPSSPKMCPQPPTRTRASSALRPSAIDPVPAMTMIPCPVSVAPARAISASVVTSKRLARSSVARMARLSSGPPLIPKQADSNWRPGSSPACAQAAATLSVTALSSRARPSPAAAWLHGPPWPVPSTHPPSSPMTAVVVDWPPSTPRKSFIKMGTPIVARAEKERGGKGRTRSGPGRPGGLDSVAD